MPEDVRSGAGGWVRSFLTGLVSAAASATSCLTNVSFDFGPLGSDGLVFSTILDTITTMFSEAASGFHSGNTTLDFCGNAIRCCL